MIPFDLELSRDHAGQVADEGAVGGAVTKAQDKMKMVSANGLLMDLYSPFLGGPSDFFFQFFTVKKESAVF